MGTIKPLFEDESSPPQFHSRTKKVAKLFDEEEDKPVNKNKQYISRSLFDEPTPAPSGSIFNHYDNNYNPYSPENTRIANTPSDSLVGRWSALFGDEIEDEASKMLTQSQYKQNKDAKAKALFDEEVGLTPTPIQPQNIITDVYKNHPLLKGKKDSFLIKVMNFDKSTNLDSAIPIMKYGEVTQKQIGVLLTNVSELSSKMVQLGIPDIIADIIECISALNIDNFTGKKSGGFFGRDTYYTVEDYINVFAEHSIKVESLISNLITAVNKVNDMVVISEHMMERQADLVEDLEALDITGKIIVERNNNKMFREQNEIFLHGQFEKRLLDLTTYENVTMLTLSQAKLVLGNLISMSMNALSLTTTTYPVWKSTLSSQITKWQSSGMVKRSATIKDLMADDSIKVALEKNKEFLQSLVSTKGS